MACMVTSDDPSAKPCLVRMAGIVIVPKRPSALVSISAFFSTMAVALIRSPAAFIHGDPGHAVSCPSSLI